MRYSKSAASLCLLLAWAMPGGLLAAPRASHARDLRPLRARAAYCARVHDASGECDALEHVAILYKAAGRYPDALREARKLERVATSAGIHAQHAEALVVQSMCLALESREAEALQVADSALAL